MEKNRLFILISAGVAILGSLLPWASLNAGAFGSYSVHGFNGDGWFVIIAAIVSIVLTCLNNVNKPMPKGFAISVIVAGAISTLVTLVNLFSINKYVTHIGGYGVSIGFGLILSLLASIALVVTGLLAMSGGKITKDSLAELAESGKDFAQTVGRVTSTTVKTAVEEIKKETQEHKKEETTAETVEKESEQNEETTAETVEKESEQNEETTEPAHVEAETENKEPVKEESVATELAEEETTEFKNEEKEEQKDPSQADK
ncbi:lantibiotic ABC transporter permease [Streptococcus pseudopneumoniae]|uniref:lantibiotic ABC transporter permease n=1 Tax=Streptococcus pseudopneumoniae TaxID=257758 RepID=UPI00066AE897|nr:lantibiotic ABC transporter permease [Streptococcus pseudopneumoniae]